jgi:hypothetical protein
LSAGRDCRTDSSVKPYHAGGVPANCGSGEQVGAGLDINRATRKQFNGLESHPCTRNSKSRPCDLQGHFAIIHMFG